MNIHSGDHRFRCHILVCVNERPANSSKGSCASCQGFEIRQQFVSLIRDHGLKGQVRATKSYCLDACELGAAVVIYPADRWYVQVEAQDVPQIFNAEVLLNQAYPPKLATAETWARLKRLRQEKPL